MTQVAVDARHRLREMIRYQSEFTAIQNPEPIVNSLTPAQLADLEGRELKSPDPQAILAARKEARLSQTAAAALVWVSPRAWQYWEGGERKMPRAIWEFFKIRLTHASPFP
jgi:DNA-binding transcriptional regulator YiaG